MKKIIGILSLTLLISLCPCYAQEVAFNAGIMSGGVTAAAAGCTLYDSQEIGGDSGNQGYSSDLNYLGQGGYVPAANITLCKVGYKINTIFGTISGINYQVEVYNMSGNDLGTAPSGTCVSNTVDGGTFSIGSFAYFTGLSCSLLSSGSYGIALVRSDHAVDTTNRIRLEQYTDNLGFSGWSRNWKTNKTLYNQNGEDMVIEIFAQ